MRDTLAKLRDDLNHEIKAVYGWLQEHLGRIERIEHVIKTMQTKPRKRRKKPDATTTD